MLTVSVLIPLGAGLVRWRFASRPMRIFVVLLLYIAGNDVAMIILASKSINNIFVFHIGLVIMYPILAYLFSLWAGKKQRQLMQWSIPIFIVVVVILLVMGYENLKRPPVYSLSLFGVLLTIISLSTFFTILQSNGAIPVYRDERFWVSLGVFISWTSSAFIYSGIVGDITINIWIVHNLLHTIGNLCYLPGYLWIQTQTIS